MSGARINMALVPSRRHHQLLVAGHVVLLLCIVLLPAAALAKTALLVLLASSAYCTYRTELQRRNITHLTLDHNCWSMVYCEQRQDVEALVPIVVTAQLTVIKLRCRHKTYVLPLWPDSADAQELRRLRVWLLAAGWKQAAN